MALRQDVTSVATYSRRKANTQNREFCFIVSGRWRNLYLSCNSVYLFFISGELLKAKNHERHDLEKELFKLANQGASFSSQEPSGPREVKNTDGEPRPENSMSWDFEGLTVKEENKSEHEELVVSRMLIKCIYQRYTCLYIDDSMFPLKTILLYRIYGIYNKIYTFQCGTYCYQCGSWLYTIWEEYIYRIGNDHVSLVECRIFSTSSERHKKQWHQGY